MWENFSYGRQTLHMSCANSCVGYGTYLYNNGRCEEGPWPWSCSAGTDHSDCRNSCNCAHDGRCDEGMSISLCPYGTDQDDCAPLRDTSFLQEAARSKSVPDHDFPQWTQWDHVTAAGSCVQWAHFGILSFAILACVLGCCCCWMGSVNWFDERHQIEDPHWPRNRYIKRFVLGTLVLFIGGYFTMHNQTSHAIWDACASHPCTHGTCFAWTKPSDFDTREYSCICFAGWEGDHCERPKSNRLTRLVAI